MVVVTGGLGFIGNELVRQHSNQGYEVVIVDNRNRVAPRLDDIKHIPVVDIDIVDYPAMLSWFKSHQVDTVYHLAAVHYIPECNDNPERTLRINVEGTQSVLRASAEAGVRKVIFASSGAVYADSAGQLDENARVAPVDVYGYSKWFGEQVCALTNQLYGTAIVVARLFNNYGPRETNPHIIPEIINQLRRGNQLSLGKITTVRDYIHTSDCAKALIRLASSHEHGVEVVNVATGKGYTVMQLIETIGEITGRSLKVVHDSQRVRKFDKQTQIADINRLKLLAQWEPEVDIRAGLAELLTFEGLLEP